MDQEISDFLRFSQIYFIPYVIYEKSLYFGCNLLSECLFLLKLAI